MRAGRIVWGGVAFAALLAAGVLVRQHLAIATLRVRLGAMRRGQTESADLREENVKLAAQQPREADREALRRAQAALDALRRKISVANPQILADPKVGELLPAGAWKFAGRATPRDTVESILWAATHGDIDQLATLIQFNPATRKKAEAFFAQLPEAAQAQYGSPEKVFATMLAGNMPTDIGAMGVLAAPSNSASGDSSTALLRLQRESGLNKDVYFNFQKDADGWQLVIPPGVESAYEHQLAGASAPLASAPDRINLPPVPTAAPP